MKNLINKNSLDRKCICAGKYQGEKRSLFLFFFSWEKILFFFNTNILTNVLWYLSKKCIPQWGQISPNSLKKITSLEWEKLVLPPSSFMKGFSYLGCECLDSFAGTSGVWHQQCPALSSVVMLSFSFISSRSLTHTTGAAGAYQGKLMHVWDSWVNCTGPAEQH